MRTDGKAQHLANAWFTNGSSTDGIKPNGKRQPIDQGRERPVLRKEPQKSVQDRALQMPEPGFLDDHVEQSVLPCYFL